jgi:hypothetical protein
MPKEKLSYCPIEEEKQLRLFFLSAEKKSSQAVPLEPGKCKTRREDFHPDVITAAIERRIPHVLFRVRLPNTPQIAMEVQSELNQLIADPRPGMYNSHFSYGQFMTKLLFCAANEFKKRLRRQPPVSLGLPGDIHAPDAVETDGEQKRFPTPVQTVEQVRQTLQELSDCLQRSAHRVWFEGKTVNQHALEEEVSREAIRSRLSRVRRHLSKHLNIRVQLRGRSRR